jgi:hypothetical protein
MAFGMALSAMAGQDTAYTEQPLATVRLFPFALRCGMPSSDGSNVYVETSGKLEPGDLNVQVVDGRAQKPSFNLPVQSVAWQRADAITNIRIRASGDVSGKRYTYELILRLTPGGANRDKYPHSLLTTTNGVKEEGTCVDAVHPVPPRMRTN